MNTGSAPHAVEHWFGASFDQLSPEIQALHRHGGILTGRVALRTGPGLAGMIGRRLAKRLGLPEACDAAKLTVSIYSDEQGLHWNRQFDDGRTFLSLFKPHGRFPDGYWSEHSGTLMLQLKVDIHDGGWHWVHTGTKLGRVSIPNWLMPRTLAHKKMVNGMYAFSVSISVPMVGEVLSYQGQLACHGG
jgi:hypothetical protein